MPTSTKKTSPAKHGDKMIELTVRFWTNKIADREGEIVPKNAWASGVISLARNESHGIEPQNPKPFHSLMDLMAIMEKVLIAHGITLHRGRRSEKYLE